MTRATAEERRHSTPEMLATERRLIEGALARRGEGAGVVEEHTVDAALGRRPSLGGEQAEMVRRLTRDGDGVQVVAGKAGAGKTFALDAAREAWEHTGHRVSGAAVARRAARELEDGAGIESTSLAALLADLREGGDYGLAPRSVVVIDEASMAGTRDLAELLDHAAAAGAKVVLVGDDRQLPEIDAGGAFRALIARTDPIVLTENRRQRETWERAALEELRTGRPEEAIKRYQEHGRVVLGEDADAVRGRLVHDWWQARTETDATMVAARRGDVSDLNGRARALMRESVQLGPDALRIDGRDFAVGDEVVTLKNARRLGVLNGTRGVVTAIDTDTVEINVCTTDGRDVRLPRGYLESTTEHGLATLDHAYAITGHKAQGITTGATFVLGTDELYREWGYVAMSRGREENRLYVVAPSARGREEYAPEEPKRDPLEALVSSLRYSKAQTAALDVAAREGIGGMPTTDLAAERARLAERIGGAPSVRPRELERVTQQRAAAERAAEAAKQRAEQSDREAPRRRRDTRPGTADRAIEAQARERAVELAARQRELEAAATAPADLSPERTQDVARYAAIDEELGQRHQGAARAAIVEKPGYLINELGPYPERRRQRGTWDRTAMRVEMYRRDFGVDDVESALGTEPRELRQRSAWRDTRRDIDRARRELAQTSERARDRGHELG